MPSYRYPGPRPFEENDITLFFGREKDKKNLLTFINVEPLLVVFSKSGLGKSSLINAAVIPELRKKNYEIIVCRFNSYVNKEQSENSFEQQTPLQKLFNEVKNKQNNQPTFLDELVNNTPKLSLWHQFKNLQITATEKANYFIFFDQFEELFTYPQQQIKEFKEHLAELLNASVPQEYLDEINALENSNADALTDAQLGLLYDTIPVKILCTIRSDKFSLLTNLKDAIPGIVTKTYELKPFNSLEATDAITKPAALENDAQGNTFLSNAFVYDDDAINKMLTYLTDNNTEDIESFQLQVLCRYAEDIVIENKLSNNEIKNITEDRLGDIKNIFEDYYNKLIEGIDKDKVNNVKKLFEEGLIFEKDKIRVPLYKGQITETYGIDDALLYKLVNTHLMRSELDTNGKEKFELSHDSLIEPILKAKEKRLAEEKEQQLLQKQKEDQQKQLLVNEEEKKRLETQFQMQKLKNRNRIFAVVIIFILVIFIGLFYLLKQNEKYNVSSIQFRNDERDWFYSLTASQQDWVLRKNFLFLKNKDVSKYNKIKFSYKCAALSNQSAKKNFQLALKLAQEGFFKDSNKVITECFNNLINKNGVYFPAIKITTPAIINNTKTQIENNVIIATTNTGIFWYNLKTGNAENALTGKVYQSDYSAFSPDGNYVLYEKYNSDSTFLLNLKTRQLETFINHYNLQPHSIALDINARHGFFVHSDGEKTINVFTLKGALIKSFTLPLQLYDKINELSISPDGNYIAAGSAYGNVFLVDIINKQSSLMTSDSSSELSMQTDIINSISFSHDGKFVITGSADYSVNVWDVQAHHNIQTIKTSSSVFKCKFSRNDEHIIIGDEQTGLIIQWTKGQKIQNYQDKGIRSDTLNFNKDTSVFMGLDTMVASIDFFNNDSNIIASSNHSIIILNLQNNPVTIQSVLNTKSIARLKLNEKVALKLEPLQDLLQLTRAHEVFTGIKMLNDSLDYLNQKTDAIKENRQTFIQLSNLMPKLYAHLKDCKQDSLHRLAKIDSFDLYIYIGNSYFYKILLDEDSLNGNFRRAYLDKMIAFRQAPFTLDTLYKKCFDDLFSAYSLAIYYYFKNNDYNNALYWTNKIFYDNPQLKTINEIQNSITIVNQYDVSFKILNGDIEGAKQSIEKWPQTNDNINYILTKQLTDIFAVPGYTFSKNKFKEQLAYFDLQDEDNNQTIGDMDAIAYRLIEQENSRKFSSTVLNNLTDFDNYIYSLIK